MDDSAAKQHLAFQEFMLGGGGGGGGKKKKKKNSVGSGIRGGGGHRGSGGSSSISTPSPSSSSSKKNRKGGSHHHYQGALLSSSSPSPSSSIKKQQQQRSSSRKKYINPILKVIQTKLMEWNDVDGQIKAILDSISNLRFRIWIESCKLLEKKHNSEENDDSIDGGDDDGRREWEGYGLRGNINSDIGKRSSSSSSSCGCVLSINDIELALNYDTLQHERMMAGLRTLISTLSQILDSIGRRLDEWMKIQYENNNNNDGGYYYDEEEVYYYDDGTTGQEVLVALEMVQQSFLFLSDELYRKQVLVKNVLDTCHDGLIAYYRIGVDVDDYDIDNGDHAGNKMNPRLVARRSCNQWHKQQSDDDDDDDDDDDSKKGNYMIEELLNIGSIQE